MARVGQYKALGTKLGGYKSTLSKIESKEYGKKHADWKAQEQISLYNEIGGTVANIIGIAKEAKELKKLQPLERPDRPTVGPSQMQPDEISSEDFGFLDANERQDLGIESDVTGTILDTESMQMRGPSEDVLGTISEPREKFDATNDYDTIGGRAGATAYKEISTSTPTIMSQNPNVYGMENEALRNANSPYLQNPDDYKPSGVSPTFLPNEVTDNTAFNAVSDPLLGDLDTSVKSSSVEQAMLNKFGKSGATSETINQMANIIGAVESGNQNISQIGGGPGRGIYQFETGKGQGFETALNRIKRMYTEKQHLGKDKYPSWIDKAMKHGDASKLTPDQQKELLIADLYMKAGSDEYLKTAFSSGNYKDLWLESHWAGADEDKESKSAYYDSVMTKNKRRKY